VRFVSTGTGVPCVSSPFLFSRFDFLSDIFILPSKHRSRRTSVGALPRARVAADLERCAFSRVRSHVHHLLLSPLPKKRRHTNRVTTPGHRSTLAGEERDARSARLRPSNFPASPASSAAGHAPPDPSARRSRRSTQVRCRHASCSSSSCVLHLS
jgi:hypothetical protein